LPDELLTHRSRLQDAEQQAPVLLPEGLTVAQAAAHVLFVAVRVRL